MAPAGAGDCGAIWGSLPTEREGLRRHLGIAPYEARGETENYKLAELEEMR